MKGDFFMAKTKKNVRPLWVVLTQGGLVSLCVYFAGVLGLRALVVNGTAGEGSAPGILAVLCGLLHLPGHCSQSEKVAFRRWDSWRRGFLSRRWGSPVLRAGEKCLWWSGGVD